MKFSTTAALPWGRREERGSVREVASDRRVDPLERKRLDFRSYGKSRFRFGESEAFWEELRRQLKRSAAFRADFKRVFPAGGGRKERPTKLCLRRDDESYMVDVIDADTGKVLRSLPAAEAAERLRKSDLRPGALLESEA